MQYFRGLKVSPPDLAACQAFARANGIANRADYLKALVKFDGNEELKRYLLECLRACIYKDGRDEKCAGAGGGGGGGGGASAAAAAEAEAAAEREAEAKLGPLPYHTVPEALLIDYANAEPKSYLNERCFDLNRDFERLPSIKIRLTVPSEEKPIEFVFVPQLVLRFEGSNDSWPAVYERVLKRLYDNLVQSTKQSWHLVIDNYGPLGPQGPQGPQGAGPQGRPTVAQGIASLPTNWQLYSTKAFTIDFGEWSPFFGFSPGINGSRNRDRKSATYATAVGSTFTQHTSTEFPGPAVILSLGKDRSLLFDTPGYDTTNELIRLRSFYHPTVNGDVKSELICLDRNSFLQNTTSDPESRTHQRVYINPTTWQKYDQNSNLKAKYLALLRRDLRGELKTLQQQNAELQSVVPALNQARRESGDYKRQLTNVSDLLALSENNLTSIKSQLANCRFDANSSQQRLLNCEQKLGDCFSNIQGCSNALRGAEERIRILQTTIDSDRAERAATLAAAAAAAAAGATPAVAAAAAGPVGRRRASAASAARRNRERSPPSRRDLNG